MAKKKRKTMAELAAGHKEFMKGKEENPDGLALFERTLKNAIPKPPKRQRGPK